MVTTLKITHNFLGYLPSPVAGEGARRAGEGGWNATGVNDFRKPNHDCTIWKPSSGTACHPLPQREKVTYQCISTWAVTIPLLLFFSLSCCLSGCATKAPLAATNGKVSKQKISTLKNFDISGKIGFSDGTSGGNASITWEQRNHHYAIHLYGPFGAGAVQVVGEPGRVYLKQSNGRSVVARTAEGLVKSETGWSIPVSGLRYWILGIPIPKQSKEALLNKNGRLQQLQQQGWTIVYQAYQQTNGLNLPYKMTLQNGQIYIKLILHRWDFS